MKQKAASLLIFIIFTITLCCFADDKKSNAILVDLDNNGIETTKLKDMKYFDYENDGFAENTAWVSKRDGILAIDKNGNGKIDNGNEIFGNNYIKSDGKKAVFAFAALKDLDSNNDKIIDEKDADFNKIRVLKGNGALLTLKEAGILSINLNPVISNTVDKNGNTIVSKSSYTRLDGTNGIVAEYFLVVDKVLSRELKKVEVSKEISIFPNVNSLGTVHSLHQAMQLDKTGRLKELVKKYILEKNENAKKDLIEKMLYIWVDTSKIEDGSRGEHYDAKKLYVIENFVGQKFLGINKSGRPNVQAAALLDKSYDGIIEYVYYTLEVQCNEELKEIYKLFFLEYDFDSASVEHNFTDAIKYIDEELSNDKDIGKEKLKKAVLIIKNLGMNTDDGYTKFYNHYAQKGAEYKALIDNIMN